MDLLPPKKLAAYLHNLYSVNSNTDTKNEMILKKKPLLPYSPAGWAGVEAKVCCSPSDKTFIINRWLQEGKGFNKEHQKGAKVHTGSSSKSEGQEALSCSEKGLESRTSPWRLTTGMEHPGGSDGGSSKSSSLLTVLTSTSMFAM